MAISKQVIVEASITILNRDGIENLTMRTIANELQIKAASLYWHVGGKLELYGAIAEYLCTQYTMPEKDGAEVQSFLMEAYQAYRSMLLSIRDSVPIFEQSIPNTPQRVNIIKATIDAVSSLSVADTHLITAANLLNNYVLSFVADEMRFRNTSPETFAEFPQLLGSFDRRLFTDVNYDEQFVYGLKVILAGLNDQEARK